MSKTGKLSFNSVLLCWFLASFTGCARTTHLAQVDRTFCGKSTATLYVQNDNWLDVVLYAVLGGSRFRLGEVSSIQSASFELPQSVMAASTGLYILADPIGVVSASPRSRPSGRPQTFTTDNIMIAPGHTTIELKLGNIIDQSSYSVAVDDPETP